MLKYVAEVDFSGASRSVSITTLTHQSKTRPGPVAGVLGRVPLAGLFAPRAPIGPAPCPRGVPTAVQKKKIDNRTRNASDKKRKQTGFVSCRLKVVCCCGQSCMLASFLLPKPKTFRLQQISAGQPPQQTTPSEFHFLHLPPFSARARAATWASSVAGPAPGRAAPRTHDPMPVCEACGVAHAKLQCARCGQAWCAAARPPSSLPPTSNSHKLGTAAGPARSATGGAATSTPARTARL